MNVLIPNWIKDNLGYLRPFDNFGPIKNKRNFHASTDGWDSHKKHACYQLHVYKCKANLENCLKH